MNQAYRYHWFLKSSRTTPDVYVEQPVSLVLRYFLRVKLSLIKLYN